MSGMASPAVLMAIVALGAAVGLAAKPETGYGAQARVTHRGPPGAAQIELAESAPLSTTPTVNAAPDEPALALLGVGISKAVSSLCDSALAAEAANPENVVCELSSPALKRTPDAGTDYLSLLLATR